MHGICQGCLSRVAGNQILGPPSRTFDANLDCTFVENALVFVVPNIGRGVRPPLNDPPGFCLSTFYLISSATTRPTIGTTGPSIRGKSANSAKFGMASDGRRPVSSRGGRNLCFQKVDN